MALPERRNLAAYVLWLVHRIQESRSVRYLYIPSDKLAQKEEVKLNSTGDGEHHISLAYQFKSAPVSVIDALEQKYQQIITEIFGREPVTLDSPKMHCFEVWIPLSNTTPQRDPKLVVVCFFHAHEDSDHNIHDGSNPALSKGN